ncbi:MAG: class I SAM-dependent methyltransferase [Bacteriovoracaceae bacterium]
MYFRRTLLVFSITMIAFCLTLYFQSEETVKNVKLDPTMNVQLNDDKSHSLAEFNEKITPQKLEDIVGLIFEKNKMAGEKTRVMEIGAGNGRVIMELKKLYPEVEFYGVNKEKTHEFYRRESFAVTAVSFGIMTRAELENVELPFVIFADLDFGKRLPYSGNKFDVIYSQNTLRHIKYKFELFNELLRILKPDGISIHADLPPLNIYEKGVVLEMNDAFLEFRKRGLDVTLLENGSSVMFRKRGDSQIFPVSPHQPIPENVDNLPQELMRPEMNYNLI